MAKKNLWGQIPGAADIVTPTKLLKEQASELTNLTKGVLEGSVRVVREESTFEIHLLIVAPFLDNYEYLVVYALHSVDLYPVTVGPGWERYNPKQRKECADSEQFEAAVGEILSSQQTRRVIQSLLAQSHSTAQKV
jgi:hypothetical protein